MRLLRRACNIFSRVRRLFGRSRRKVRLRAAGIQLGGKLGAGGGQGQVYAVKGKPDLAFKQFHNQWKQPDPIPGAMDGFTDLVQIGEWLRRDLEGNGVTVTWPLSVYGEHGDIEGYTMKRIPRHFRGLVRTPYGKSLQNATLDYAVTPDPKKTFVPTWQVTFLQRLQILQKVALFLDALHRNDMVYGDISMSNILCSLDPVEVLVMDLDPAHYLGKATIPRKDEVNTPDWFDPFAPPGEGPLGFDLDRYKFATLFFRLLVADHVSHPFPSPSVKLSLPAIPGMTVSQKRRLEFVLGMATGPWGSRPPMVAWLDALEPWH